MPNTLLNIIVPPNEWVNLYSLTGISVGTAIEVQNVGNADVYLTVAATQPAADFDGYNIVRRDNGKFLRNLTGDSGAWAFCQSGGKINVGLVPYESAP